VSLGALRDRNFRLLFIGQATSSFGDRLVPIALAFAVLDLTGSATDLGLVLAAQTLPMLLLVAFAGVWADRLPRQLVMLTSDLVRCGTQGATAALLLLHQAHIWELIVLQAAYGAADAFFTPAMSGLIPATAGPGRLREANALMSLSRSAVGVLGPAIGGTLVALISPGAALAVDAATFLVSAVSLFMLQLNRVPRASVGTSVLTELREGFAEVRSRTWLWVMIVYFGIFTLLAFPAFNVLGPYVAKHSLGGAGAWAIILTAGAAGFLIGGALALRVGSTRPLLYSELACLLAALPPILLGLHVAVALIAAGAMVRSIGLAWGDALWHTTVQEQIPEAAISRVSALDWTGTLVLNPIGFALVGPLAAVIGISTTLIVTGSLTVVATLAVLAVPSVRNLRTQPTAVAHETGTGV
jgi:MFS family permease